MDLHKVRRKSGESLRNMFKLNISDNNQEYEESNSSNTMVESASSQLLLPPENSKPASNGHAIPIPIKPTMSKNFAVLTLQNPCCCRRLCSCFSDIIFYDIYCLREARMIYWNAMWTLSFK